MPLVVGDLTAYLTVDNDAYKRGIRDAKGDLNDLARDADRHATATANRSSRLVSGVSRSMSTIGKDADRKGRDAGGLLAQGIRTGFMRQSPLIVAAVGAGLAAGAPVALAGATALLGGIGIVAAAQSQEVRSAWLGAWQEIRAGAISDAAVIEPVLTRMAGKVTDGFERMRPALRDAFDDAAPQIDDFTDSLIQAAENAMPGMVRAVQNADPVMAGFGSLLESTGTGLTGFFHAMTDHAPAAGKAFSAIGQVLEELLPTLGELLGSGAELASIVLPPLAKALGVVADGAEALGPLLPATAVGFAGMKVAQTAAGWVGTLSGRLGTLAQDFAFASYNGDTFAGGAGKLSTATSGASRALSAFGGALPIVGLALGEFAREAADSQARVDQWTQTIIGGGKAAADLRNLVAEQEGAGIWERIKQAFTPDAEHDIAEDFQKAEAAARAYFQSLSPLEQAKAKVTEWTATLSERLGDESASTADVEAAKRRLAHWQAEAARLSEAEERAIRGVTEAMLAHTDAIYARANADLALRNAVDSQEDSFSALNKAIRDNGRASEEADDAGRAWEGTLGDQIAAARRLAEEALPAAMDAGQKKAASDLAALDVLRDLEQQYGSRLPQSLRDMIPALEAATDGYDRNAIKAAEATAKAQELGRQRPKPIATLDDRVSPAVGPVISRILGIPPSRTTTAKVWDLASDAARNIAAAIYNIPPFRTTTVRTVYQNVVQTIMGINSADGGRIGSKPVRKLSGGGRVEGPGGPTDDAVGPFMSARASVFLSDDEWVIRARSSNQYGDAKMAAINAGRAIVMLPGERPRVQAMSGGGSVGGVPAVPAGATATSGVVIHGGVTVKIDGTFDLASSRDLRRAAVVIRKELVSIEREQR